jgi:hypothetical protein
MNGKGKSIYVAGPMRGHPFLNFESFFVAAHELKKAGWHVENPAAYDVDRWWAGVKWSLEQLIFFDLGKVQRCDAIYMLEGWEKSDGARCEFYFAKFLGRQLLFERIVDSQRYDGGEL